jgi:hypothetical protein
MGSQYRVIKPAFFRAEENTKSSRAKMCETYKNYTKYKTPAPALSVAGSTPACCAVTTPCDGRLIAGKSTEDHTKTKNHRKKTTTKKTKHWPAKKNGKGIVKQTKKTSSTESIEKNDACVKKKRAREGRFSYLKCQCAMVRQKKNAKCEDVWRLILVVVFFLAPSKCVSATPPWDLISVFVEFVGASFLPSFALRWRKSGAALALALATFFGFRAIFISNKHVFFFFFCVVF